MLKQKRFWLGVIVSLALIAFVFYQTDPQAIGAELARANYFFLLPALVLYFIGVYVRSIRWHFLLRSIRPVPVRALFPVVVIGYMANDILPFRLGEVVRALVLGQQERISRASILVTIVVERVLDGLTMIAFLGAVSLVAPLDNSLRAGLATVSGLLVAVVLLLILVANLREQLDRLILFFLSRLPAHLGDRLGKLIDSVLHGLNILRTPADALLAFVCSVVAWLFEASMYWMVALGFGLAKPFTMYILATALGNLASIAPSTPGYVGVFDGPIRYVLHELYGVDLNLAVSYTLLLHAALLLPVTLLGFFYLWRMGLSLGQITGPGSTRGQATDNPSI